MSDYTEKQLADLKKSEIEPEVAKALGIISTNDPNEVTSRLGRTDSEVPVPGLLFACYPKGDSTKEPLVYRYKADEPRLDRRKKVVKYEQPLGAKLPIYVPPTADAEQIYANKKRPIVFTEGEKKAITIALKTSHLAIGGFGVWGFHDPEKSDLKSNCFVPSSELREIPLHGRRAYIAFDALKVKKSNVLKAELVLARMLTDLGADVRLVQLPPRRDRPKDDLGVDEYLIAVGEEGFERLLEDAWEYPLALWLDRVERDREFTPTREDLFSAISYMASLPFDESGPIEMRMWKLFDLKKGAFNEAVRDRETFFSHQIDFGGLNEQTPLKETLEKIRQNEGNIYDPERDCYVRKEPKLAELILGDLSEHGAVLNDDNWCWYFDNQTKVVSEIEFSRDFQTSLHRQYDVNPSTREYDFLMQEVVTAAYLDGAKTRVHRQYYFDRESFTVYLANRVSEVFKITPEGYTVVTNGTDGVYFDIPKNYEPFRLVDPEQCRGSDYEVYALFETFNFAATGISKWDFYQLLKLYITYAVIVGERMPIPHIKGEHGSCKSTFSRSWGRLFMGSSFNVSSGFTKQDDLEATLSNSFMVVLDNIEKLADDMINTLCTVATGGVLNKRKLYGNNELVSFPLKCAVMMTSRGDQFLQKRPDLADRLIPIELVPATLKVPEEGIYRRISSLRDNFWTRWVLDCPLILRNLRATACEHFQTKLRMGDFWVFAKRVTGVPDKVEELGEGILVQQADSTLKGSAWFICLSKLMEEHDKVEFMTAKSYLEQLENICRDELGTTLGLNANALAKYFKEQERNLQAFYDFEVTPAKVSPKTYRCYRYPDDATGRGRGRSEVTPAPVELIEKYIDLSPLETSESKVDGGNGGNGGVFNKPLDGLNFISENKEMNDLKSDSEIKFIIPINSPPTPTPITPIEGENENVSNTLISPALRNYLQRSEKVGQILVDERALVHTLKVAEAEHYQGVANFLKNVNNHLINDGKKTFVKPKIILNAGANGSASVRDPALQNMPDGVGKLFKAGHRKVFVKGDYAQCQLRILAALCQDAALLETLNSGGDPHKITAAKIFGKRPEEVTSDERQKAKAINFGIILGMQARSLAEHAKETFNVEITEQEAEVYRRSWLEEFKSVPSYQLHLREVYAQAGSISTKAGRTRTFHKPPSNAQLMAFMLQGTEADIVQAALELIAADPIAKIFSQLVLINRDCVVLQTQDNYEVAVEEALTKHLHRAQEAVLGDIVKPKAEVKGREDLS